MRKIEMSNVTADDIRVEENALIDLQFALIDAMKAKRVTRVELASRLRVSRARVSQLLSPAANPTLKLVGRALAALELKAEYVDAKKAAAATRSEPKSSSMYESIARQDRRVALAWGVVAQQRVANENRSRQRVAA